jgi:hypothetical protein
MSFVTIGLPGNHDRSTRTAQLGQIAIRGHSDPQRRALPANDRTAFFGISLLVVQISGGLIVIAAGWAMLNRELQGRELPMGMFGDNFTSDGLSEDSVHLGDQFSIGSAEVIVTQPRLSCYKLGLKFESDDTWRKKYLLPCPARLLPATDMPLIGPPALQPEAHRPRRRAL